MNNDLTTLSMKQDEELRMFIKNLVYFGHKAGEMDEKMVNSNVRQLKEIFERYV